MRRRFILALTVGAVPAFTAGPARADINLKGDQGPPGISGNVNGAIVVHCNSEAFGYGDRGVIVTNKSGQSKTASETAFRSPERSTGTDRAVPGFSSAQFASARNVGVLGRS